MVDWEVRGRVFGLRCSLWCLVSLLWCSVGYICSNEEGNAED